MTAIVYMFAGAAIGAGVSALLYALGFAVELLNCACQILSCHFNTSDAIPGMWSTEAYINTLLFCTIAGAVIGLIYGIYKAKVKADEERARRDAENSQKALRQRVKLADEIRQEALIVDNACESNLSIYEPLVSTTYQSSAQMKGIIDELTKAAELQGKVDSIADELTKEGRWQ